LNDQTSDAPMRTELSGKTGKDYWKSLEEYSGTERFKEWLQREHPQAADLLAIAPDRRSVLQLMGASLALAGFNACTKQPEERIYAYAKNPEAMTPGTPLYFATAMPWAGGAIGVLVENHMGRPTKIEGNEAHPASLGSTDSFTQASVLDLYDPDRATTVKRRGRVSTWDDFWGELRPAVTIAGSRQGEGVRVLTRSVVSPTLGAQLAALSAAHPKLRIHVWEPIHRDNARAGAMLAFGRDLASHAHHGKAKVLVSLDSDFLVAGPESVRAAREFASNRKVRKDTKDMNRLYAVESCPTATGATADHRLAMRAVDIQGFVRRLALRLGVAVQVPQGALEARAQRFLEAIAKDLEANKGAALLVPGPWQPPVVHALVHAIHDKLGCLGRTVEMLPPVESFGAEVDNASSIKSLCDDMRSGAVQALVVLGGNPLFDAPADCDFAGALAKVPLRAHLTTHENETSRQCDWLLPEHHYLEAWSDASASDGTASIVQPLIAPLYNSKGAHDILAAMLDKGGQTAYDAVREHWKALRPDDFEVQWRRWLHDGVVPGTRAKAVSVAAKAIVEPVVAAPAGLEVQLRPDPTVWDGRYANNGWQQELPKPISKLTWDNTVQLAPATAKSLGVATGDLVEVSIGGRKVVGPAWIAPGHAADSLTIHLGYGRKHAGKVGDGVGFDAYPLRTAAMQWGASGATLAKVGGSHELASTQEHDDYEAFTTEATKRNIVRVRTIDRFKAEPGSLEPGQGHAAHHGPTDIFEKPRTAEMAALKAKKEASGAPLQAYDSRVSEDYQWGMVIDLNACTGCSACITACVAENNIAVVGKEQVMRGREMHWLRIDRYFKGDENDPEMHHQPIPCMQCENAPCEVVCPVGATSHGPEGLNEMTYNRCVGTRYCSNNCPYKVRRFNFLLYSDWATESLKMQRNPDVSVRSRGVMEKCTYCVQRISHARHAAKREDRKIREGEVVTACQQACPTEAIAFGNILDKDSRVSREKAEPHNYGLLEELNTKPRTTFLAKVQNRNPELV
jgi:molybdopterin-containing oxidoreductase family iron-sulfur binding subunit